MKRLYIILCLTCFIFTAQSAIIVVNRDDDLMVSNDGGCDLRDAVSAANFNLSIEGCAAGSTSGSDIIIISVLGPIQLSNEIDILGSMTIFPTFANTENVTIIAADNERIFAVHPTFESSNDFEMARLTLVGGNAGTSDGGAVIFYRFNDKDLGDIYITDCIFEDNQANYGGAIAFVDTYADSVTMLGNTFIHNQGSVGGALSAVNATDGVFSLTLNKFDMNNAVLNANSKIVTAGAAFIIDSSPETYFIRKNQFIENSSEGSVGALSLNGFNIEQKYHLEQNVFLYNHADSYAGGLSVGALGWADIYNSTFAYNSASRGGGFVFIGGGKIYIRNSTIVYNSASQFGQNIFSYSGTGNIRSSIIAYTAGSNNCAGNFSTISSGTRNVMDDTSCPHENAAFDTIADPLLSDLTIHPSGLSGFTPNINSAAIDKVSSCINLDGSDMLVDQQGNPRPIDANSDGIVNCDSGAIEAPVFVNQPAVANNDAPAAIIEDSNAITIDVLANDTNSGLDPIFVISKTNGSNGLVVITNGGANVSYTPNANYCGSDSFNYTITGNDSATVSIQVNCVDDAPIAVADSVTVLEDSLNNGINVLANDTDTDGGTLVIQSITQPTNGSVIITNSGTNISYQPDLNYCNDGGSVDVFSYSINGGSTKTVSVTVNCINDAPSFSVNDNIHIKLDELGNLPAQAIACLYNFGPGNENTSQSISDFSVSIASDPQGIIGTVDVANNGGLIPSFSGNQGIATINLTLIDNGGLSNGGVNSSTQQVVIHVHDYLFRNGMEVDTCQ